MAGVVRTGIRGRQRTARADFETSATATSLFVAMVCTGASRTPTARTIKRLPFISVSTLEPTVVDQGWKFSSTPADDRLRLLGHGLRKAGRSRLHSGSQSN